MGNTYSAGSGQSEATAETAKMGVDASAKKRRVAKKPEQTNPKPRTCAEKPQVKTPSQQTTDPANKSDDAGMKKNLLDGFPGKVLKPIAKHFKTKHSSDILPSDSDEPQKKTSIFKELWSGLKFVLTPNGIKFVLTAPWALLRRILPSLEAGQMNFILLVLIVVFALSIRSDTAQMHDNVIETNEKTRLAVDNLGKKFDKRQEEMEGTIVSAVRGMRDVAEATFKGASNLVGKATEIAGEAAQIAGVTFHTFKTWMGGWLTSNENGHSSPETPLSDI